MSSSRPFTITGISSPRINVCAGSTHRRSARTWPRCDRQLLVTKILPHCRLPLGCACFPNPRAHRVARSTGVVLSCYFQNIPTQRGQHVNFLSFERLARHYSDLMDIWLAVRAMGGIQWLETRYEDRRRHGKGRQSRHTISRSGLAQRQARFYEKSREKRHYSPTYRT